MSDQSCPACHHRHLDYTDEACVSCGCVGWVFADGVDRLANALYIACVVPDTIWWDDLPDEYKDGWRRAAIAAVREISK